MENFDNFPDQSLSEEEKIIQVIKDFGAPMEVASKYNSQPPLISQEYTPLFYMIMKIVSITLPGALLLANTIEYYNNTAETSIMGFLLNTAYMIPGILQAVIMALAFLFLAFIILSRYVEPKFEFKEEQFDPRYLPPIPQDVMKVSVFETIIGIIGSVVFLYLFNLQPGLIAVYFEGDRYKLLNDSFEQILPLINMNVFVSLGIYIFYLYKRRKNITSCTIEYISGILSGVIMILLASRDIFNPIIIDGYDLSILPKIFTIGLYIGGFAAMIGHTVTYIKVFFRKED